ncbi:MAG TPA: GNAT family N-acetyltransferase [Candidatus Dormibacteraeota bacterium]|nr:GNAT family N-acetyltransferase [Candidatus Dormibacteraeota bacterium]
MPAPDRIVIRRLLADDWEEFRSIRLRALADAPQAFSSTLDEALRLADDEWRHRLRGRVQFIAITGGGAVGTAGGLEDGAGAQLISMWVDPRARRSGVGSRLVTAVSEWARDCGCAALCLWVVEANLAAEGLYLRCGFSRTGKSKPVGSAHPGRQEFEMRLPL